MRKIKALSKKQKFLFLTAQYFSKFINLTDETGIILFALLLAFLIWLAA